MNDRKRLLNRISATQFAAWELHMYLDTHPCDRTANEMFRKYTDEAKMLRREYESKYGPLTISAVLCDDYLRQLRVGVFDVYRILKFLFITEHISIATPFIFPWPWVIKPVSFV